MKKWKKVTLAVSACVLVLSLAACGKKEEGAKKETASETKEIVVGVAPGPYGDMVTDVIGPLLKEKGYTVTTKLFNDYVQPNKALAAKQIDANLFQHTAYLEKFSADNELELTAVGQVPTLGMGIYSKDLKQLSDLPDGGKVSIANDASNLARTLQLLQANELITINADIDETKATVNDIAENAKNLDFKPLDAAQLARSLDNVDIALVPGNFSWAAELKPADALALEKLQEKYKNVVALRTEDKDSDLGKAFAEVLTSDEFKAAIAKSEFKDFDQPESWK
ncbi:metal ABC transporter substrate-binding protein [Vagococcus sp. BWB3-3]|uniref:Lipoprotein n=1 Tax=Vagococcus allomyrinae TaxID=2794353 RepID=A0A940SUD9_9ENTE|nr:MetQ/NlpA family ABC transporter substrate-binding protein [Vagococcus allomyrinae]MBP1044202.1 metal ABC transporter substrate-binding protein [Vagococcus allomyrinae]